MGKSEPIVIKGSKLASISKLLILPMVYDDLIFCLELAGRMGVANSMEELSPECKACFAKINRRSQPRLALRAETMSFEEKKSYVQ
jgi:hypothetical protein